MSQLESEKYAATLARIYPRRATGNWDFAIRDAKVEYARARKAEVKPDDSDTLWPL